MKKIVCTFVLLLLTLTFANAQWRQFPCLITGDNDFAHTSSVTNLCQSVKKDFNHFSRDYHNIENHGLFIELSQPLNDINTHSGICETDRVSIKSIQSDLLKRRE
jgi:hypothetical protein